MNGQDSVHIDRGRWLYRFSLDDRNISITRAPRSGQHLGSPDVWRCVAEIGVNDAFIVPAPGGWQAFVELSEGRHRWALAVRPTLEEAEQSARYLLTTLADAVAHSPQFRDAESTAVSAPSLPAPPPSPAESSEVEDALARARAERDAERWELVYNRPRAGRHGTPYMAGKATLAHHGADDGGI